MLALLVSLPPKLRVTTAETAHMPIYLRTFSSTVQLGARESYLRHPLQASRLLLSSRSLGMPARRWGDPSFFGALAPFDAC